jgi:hypothetical protein
MILVLKLFGLVPLLSVELTPRESAVEEEEEEEDEEPGILGGSAHDFERDVNPITPEDRYDWEWEDRKRGFGFG